MKPSRDEFDVQIRDTMPDIGLLKPARLQGVPSPSEVTETPELVHIFGLSYSSPGIIQDPALYSA